MEGEGRIDMSAFAGEPNHDDAPETYGGETTHDDIAFVALADLIGPDNDDDPEIPQGDAPDEIVPLPDDDPLPGDGDDEEE